MHCKHQGMDTVNGHMGNKLNGGCHSHEDKMDYFVKLRKGCGKVKARMDKRANLL